ncbi:hypothetical protein [Streptomyces sp. NPDC008092]|uniref:hypothetical protein n=1 Tax=Streptomyces sp. NPDC008092 TaxID=3364808 RepID=UPI0036F101F6
MPLFVRESALPKGRGTNACAGVTDQNLTGRGARVVTGGCLAVLVVLVLVLGTGLAWTAYAFHRVGEGNADRRTQARAAVERQARQAVSATVRALTAARTAAGGAAAQDIVLRDAGDPDSGGSAVAPDLVYDRSTGRLTVVTPFSGGYEVRPALWGAVRTESETRCQALAFRRGTGGRRADVTARPEAECARRQPVTGAAQSAQEALRALVRPGATRSEVRQLLASAGSASDAYAYDVIRVTGQVTDITVTVLVYASGQQQCYRFVRHTGSRDSDPVTVLPVAGAHCEG